MADADSNITGNSPTTPAMEHHDPAASKMGMWLFLFTEIILFGTLFIAYAVYLHLYKGDFQTGSNMLDVPIGAANTVILLTSSLTMAISIGTLKRGRKSLCLATMGATILFAVAFLVIKGFEWSTKFHHDIYPNSPLYDQWPQGQVTFFGLYYSMTGLHAIHVFAGVVVILIAAGMVKKERINRERYAFLENTGLYWHLVDIVWIYLFPLFYLIG